MGIGEMAGSIFSVFGQPVATGGVSVVVAYLLFKYLGISWLKQRLSKGLADHKADLDKQVAVAKEEISFLSNRRMKLHDKEYVVLPLVWCQLNCVKRDFYQLLYLKPEKLDFSSYSDDEFKEWMEEQGYSVDEKEWFRKQSNKVNAAFKIRKSRAVTVAYDSYQKFLKLYEGNKIFLRPVFKGKLDDAHTILAEIGQNLSQITSQVAHEESESLLNELDPIVKDIEGEMQKLLFAEES